MIINLKYQSSHGVRDCGRYAVLLQKTLTEPLMEYNRFLGHNKGGKNWFLSPVFTISMNVCNMSAVLACLSTMALTPCWCSATVAALFLELFEACNNRKTKAFFSKQGAPKWATLQCAPHLCPSLSKLKGRVVCTKKKGGNMPALSKLCLYISPDCWQPWAFTKETIVCLVGRKHGHFVSIISGSLMFNIVGAQHASCIWKQSCSLCPFPSLCTGICPLCPLCRLLNAPGLQCVHTCGGFLFD